MRLERIAALLKRMLDGLLDLFRVIANVLLARTLQYRRPMSGIVLSLWDALSHMNKRWKLHRTHLKLLFRRRRTDRPR